MRDWFAAVAIGVLLVPGLGRAEGALEVKGAFALVATENAPNAAVFMEIVNGGTTDDRLIAVETEVAARAELHTHVMSAEGMMQMLPVEGGYTVEAATTRALARGGDHVMLMGLTQAMPDGAQFTLTLTFEQAGKVVVVVPVQDAAPMQHGDHNDAINEHGGHGAMAPASE